MGIGQCAVAQLGFEEWRGPMMGWKFPSTSGLQDEPPAKNKIKCRPIGGPLEGVSISSRFRDIALYAYWGHEFHLSESRDVIGHVTI